MSDTVAQTLGGGTASVFGSRTEAAKRLIGGAAIEISAFGFGQLIRLASNLLLTRLLFPEAFGLMSILAAVLFGLQMLSDVGIQQAVIRSSRGENKAFLDTAWTMQVIRGVILSLSAVLLAWPLAILLQEPSLAWIVPIGALSVLAHGFSSPRQFVLRRHLRVGPLAALDIASQLVGSAVMLLGAYLGLGLPALLSGLILQTFVQTAGSFLLPGEHSPCLHLDRASYGEILQFGRWIFASSALTFAAARGDQFLLARLVGATQLGFYSIALALAEVADAVAHRLIASILYPLFSRVHNENPDHLPRLYYRIRLPFDAFFQGGLGLLCGIAPLVIGILYDDRYQAVSPMLQVLAVRAAINLMASVCETCLTSQGLSVLGFRRNAYVTVSVFALMPLGYWLAGVSGLLWGSALSRIAAFAAIWPTARRLGILKFSHELLAPVFFLTGYAIGVELS